MQLMNKKRLCLLGLLCLIPMLGGCSNDGTPLKEGSYESISVTENGDFSKAKYELREIGEAEYAAAEEINVIEDGAAGSNKKHYSFILYFYLDAAADYVQIETRRFGYKKGSGSVYTAVLEYDSDFFSFTESFVFDCSKYSIFWFLEGSAEIILNFRYSD